MGLPAEADFYVVRRPETLNNLTFRLYGSMDSAIAREFMRINQAALDAAHPGSPTTPADRLQIAQLLYLPDGVCQSELKERDLKSDLYTLNRKLLEEFQMPERRMLAEQPKAVSHLAAMKSGIDLANSGTAALLSGVATQTRSVKTLLTDLDRRYVSTYKAHGRMTPAFFQYRQNVYRQLDTGIGRIARTVAIGTPYTSPARAHLRINIKSQILEWSREGRARGVTGLQSHIERTDRIRRYLRYGGYATIALDASLTSHTVNELCQSGSGRDCQRRGFKEYGSLGGRVVGGSGGASLAYYGCSVAFAPLSKGSSFLWCGLVAGGAGAALGGVGGDVVGGRLGGAVHNTHEFIKDGGVIGIIWKMLRSGD